MTKREDKLADAIGDCRDYLTVLAQMQITDQLRSKIDTSDVVHETLLKAHQSRDDFAGSSEAELLAWLRRIMANTIAEQFRHYGRAKRDVARERSISQKVEESSVRLEEFLAASDPPADRKLQRQEQLLQLVDLLGRLPDAQRSAIVMHHIQGLSVAEVAARTDQTAAAVAGQLRRGMKTLRSRLHRQAGK